MKRLLAMKKISLFFLLGFFISFGVEKAFCANTYTITDLGALDNSQFSSPYRVNGAGQVVGWASKFGTNGYDYHAFLYDSGIMHDLGTLGGTCSHAYGISNTGQVIGGAYLSGDTGEHAFLYESGTMRSLGTLGGTSSTAYDINGSGQIVGFSQVSGNLAWHAFLYSSDTGIMHDIGTLGGMQSSAYGINNSGQIVGYSQFSYDKIPHHAFLYTPGIGMHDLGTLGGEYSCASDINDSGQVIGYARLSNTYDHAFLYESGIMRDLGTLGGTTSYALGVNNSGQIVGYSRSINNTEDRAFIYDSGTMYDLNNLLVPSSGWTLRMARAINDSGQIVCDGITSDGLTHAVLLTPVIEPSSMQVVCSGFQAPMDNGPVKVKKNRVLPLKAELFNKDGVEVTGTDLPVFPVIQVVYRSSTDADAQDVSQYALPVGAATPGNQFQYVDEQWQYNLQTKNYTARGTYEIAIISGDESHYRITTPCMASFVIE